VEGTYCDELNRSPPGFGCRSRSIARSAILPTGMFEKYNETARRSVFMARYEASQAGSGYIETEHLLLGILRMDKDLAVRLRLDGQTDSIRKQVEERHAGQERVATSVDMPLSHVARRVLEKAGAEAERRMQKHIGSEHLLLGIYLEEESLGARILRATHVTREELDAAVDGSPSRKAPPDAASLLAAIESRVASAGPEPKAELLRNLSQAARNGELGALIGREREVSRILQILGRRKRNNPLLVGEPGVAKTAILDGVAEKIAGDAPSHLQERPIFSIDASALIAPGRRRSADVPERIMAELGARPIGILFVDGLLDLAHSGASAVEAAHVLDRLFRHGIQCVATGTPAGLRRAFEDDGVLVRQFEVVEILPPTEEETVAILKGIKERYETFHQVTFGEGVIEAAVFASGRFLPLRHLPERALDLLDDAGARARVRRHTPPSEELELRKKLQRLDLEAALTKHDFAKANEIAAQERTIREKLSKLEPPKTAPEATPITAGDLEEAIAERVGLDVAAVRQILEQKKGKEGQTLARKLAAIMPADQQSWLPFLASHLAACSPEAAETLAQAIRDAKRE